MYDHLILKDEPQAVLVFDKSLAANKTPCVGAGARPPRIKPTPYTTTPRDIGRHVWDLGFVEREAVLGRCLLLQMQRVPEAQAHAAAALQGGHSAHGDSWRLMALILTALGRSSSAEQLCNASLSKISVGASQAREFPSPASSAAFCRSLGRIRNAEALQCRVGQ